MRVVILTKIFPNQREPLSSPFNRQQFAAFARLCDVEILATIPWFPAAGLFAEWSRAGRLLGVPDEETIEGMRVRHPRFLFVPRFAPGLAGPLYVASLARAALRCRGKVDVVLGSWAYPDGFAAVVLAGMLGVPSVVKLHGSDMNVVSRLPGPRRQLAWALPRADRVVAVSGPLRDAAIALGAPAIGSTSFATASIARAFARRTRPTPAEPWTSRRTAGSSSASATWNTTRARSISSEPTRS